MKEAAGKGAAILLAYYFPPFNVVASQRALKMARVLLRHFSRLHVITVPADLVPPAYVDGTLGRDVLADPRLRIVPARPLLDGYGLVPRPRLTHRLLGAALARFFCSAGADWLPAVTRALGGLLRDHSVDLIVSTGGPFLPFVAAARCGRQSDARVLLDYRDLWSQCPRAPYPRLSRLLVRHTVERYANARCAAIVTVSDACGQSLAEARPASPIEVLPNTPDRHYVDWFASVRPACQLYGDRGALHIALTGTVYRECTCRTLWRAVQLLEPPMRRRIKLHYFGPSARLVQRECAEFGMSGNLVSHGLVSKEAAIAAVRGADVLLSLVSDAPNELGSRAVRGLMTTKIFDYLLSGKPILNIGPSDGDINALADSVAYARFQSFGGLQVRELSHFLTGMLEDLAGVRTAGGKPELPDFAAEFGRILHNVRH